MFGSDATKEFGRVRMPGEPGARDQQTVRVCPAVPPARGSRRKLGDSPQRTTHTRSTVAPLQDGGDETLTLLRYVRDDLGTAKAKAGARVRGNGTGQDIGAAELPEVDRLLNELIGRLITLGESAGTATHEVAPVRQAGVSATLHLRRAAVSMPDRLLHLHG